ncbi:MAG: hypothetical protein HKN87_06355 [Saprospiraceae bacterium]|nr:hypothetical protein [Saprospiraceae bacterium]
MKPILTLLMILIQASFSNLSAQYSGGGESNPELTTHSDALRDFQDLRFGMFIHWGPVTLRGTEIGWSRGREVAIEEYDQLYIEFNPVLFDATSWVATAKEAGMKYMILTSRHHDGFSLWDSRYTDYDMGSTPYGRGVIQELADACKKQGIKFGVYYSICDWRHEDYPVKYPDPNYQFHVEREISDAESKVKMDRYILFIKNQLKELIDHYDVSFIWFDGEWEWAWTHEMGMDLYKYVRGLKDDILINNRVDKGREGMAGITKSKKFAGDYATPEQQVGAFDLDNAWETCMTIGEQWAWKANDKLKSDKECLQTLLRTVGGNGNLLFNVGPMADGRMEQRQIKLLSRMGNWLKVNGDAVYGTRGGPYQPTEYMVSTRKGNKIFLHLLHHPGPTLILPVPLDTKINRAYFLDGKDQIRIKQFDKSVDIALPNQLPDNIASVIVLEIDGEAQDIDVVERTRY